MLMIKDMQMVMMMAASRNNNFPKILWPFLFCFLISIPSSLSVPVKGRESSGIVLHLEEQQKELRCIKSALWHEARGEPEEGIRAVMSVIYNRKKHKNFPSTFCGVILQDKQFSAFNQDKGLATRGLKPIRELDKKAHAMVAYIAQEAVLGRFKPVLEPSVLFYTKTSVRNRWTKRMEVVNIVSSHKFMKVKTSGGDTSKKVRNEPTRTNRPSN